MRSGVQPRSVQKGSSAAAQQMVDDIVGRQCEASIKNWLGSGGESEAAKKALLQLIRENPKNSLPRRYLARLLFHEAAGAISPGTVGSNSSLQRIQLLTEAYEHAAVATDLSPNSLSCAALRATLAINLLVEESALLTPTPSASGAPQLAAPGASSSTPVEQQPPHQQQPASSCTVLDRKCQELLQRFLGSIDACKVALEHPHPVLREPLITFTTATHTTCDPCSLLVEKIMDCSRAGKLQEVVAEKRSVLTSMQQVLQSCYALLDSTQVPLHSIIRLLQHILRPYGAEQQMLASSRVNTGSFAGTAGNHSSHNSSNPAAQLPASQLHHAAIGELLRLLRPGSNPAYTAATAAAAAASTAVSNAAAAAAAAVAAAAPAPITCDASAAAPGADADLAPLPLSVEKPWDTASTAAAGHAGSKVGAGHARGGAKGRSGRSRAPGAAAAAGKKGERSRRERFMDVESFWRSCSPQQRLQLLRVPLAPLLAGVQQDSGAAAAEVLMEGLVLLREQEHSSCYWLCAACDRKFHTARDFNIHLETCHEQLVLTKPLLAAHKLQVPAGAGSLPASAAGKGAAAPQQQPLVPFCSSSSMPPPATYVSCGKCQAPVVGMYFTRAPPPKQVQQQASPAAAPGEEDANERSNTLCIKCYRELTAVMGEAGADRSYSRVSPHGQVSPRSNWSETGSDFISTRDSFSSCGDDVASCGTLSGAEAAAPEDDAAAGSAQPRQYDAAGGRMGNCVHSSGQRVQLSPDLAKVRGAAMNQWRSQQQRALAWRAHRPGVVAAAGSASRGPVRAITAPELPQQQQQHQQTQQQLAPPASSGAGIFVFGSNHNAASGSSMSPTPGGFAASSGGVVVSAGAAGAAGGGTMGSNPPSPVQAPQQQQQQQQQGLLGSPVSSSPGPGQQQRSTTTSSLAAYWQRQQLLLCTTDAAAAELLDGLEVVQKAKELDSRQLSKPTLPARRGTQPGNAAGQPSQAGSAPVTGTKRPAPSAGVGQVTAGLLSSGAAGRQAEAPVGPAGVDAAQMPAPVCTGSSAQASGGGAAGAAGGGTACGVNADADAADDAGADGTPSGTNRSWRDWLLPKKLLQWNEDEGELLQLGQEPGSDDDLSDDTAQQGADQGRAAATRPVSAPAGAGSSSRSQVEPVHGHVAMPAARQRSSADGGCLQPHLQRQQQQRERAAVPTVVITELSDDTAGVGEGEAAGPVGPVGSAPCSPRTPSAQDGWRPGAADTAASSGVAVSNRQPDAAAAAAAASSSRDSILQAPCVAASTSQQAAALPGASCAQVPGSAGAAAAALGAVDSLGACLAAAAPGVLVDEIMRCMQHLYDSDADIADETLLCLVDFLQRKLNPQGCKRFNVDAAAAAVIHASRRANSALLLEQVSPPAAAAAAAAGLSADESAMAAELLAAPEIAFLCPLAMRAALCCLAGSDLQMALAYIVRQAGAPLAGGSVEIESTCGSSADGGSLASSSGGGSMTGEDDGADTASQSDSQELDEECGCMSLFQLYHLDEVAFERLVAQLWPGELRASDATAAAALTADATTGPAAATGKAAGAAGGAGSSKQQRQSVQQQSSKVAAAAATSKGTSSSSSSSSKACVGKDRMEPVLLVSAWWLEHLRQSSKSKDPAGDAEADIRVLRWVYGSIESAQAEELASRQASLRGGLDRTAALQELYEGLAGAWRRMQRVADRQRRLEHLRGRVKAKFAEVKALEEAGQHGSSQQAAAFLDSLNNSLGPTQPPAASALPSPSAAGTGNSTAAPHSSCSTSLPADAAPAAGEAAPAQQQAARAAAAATVALSPLMQLTTYMTKLAPLYLCEAAVAAVRAAPLLASEASQHYACALLERELAVLALMEAKLEHDVASARQRLQAANDRLLTKRGTELAAAEAEQAKLVADGPASHRKKDLLDKATKETEHRQKLADVKGRIEAAKSSIAEDEAVAASAELAAAEGTASLLHAQDLARQMNMRLKTLQDFNAQLAALLPPLHAAVSASSAGQGVQLQAGVVADSRSTSSSCSAAYGSPTSASMDSNMSSNSPQTDATQGASSAAPAAAACSFAEAHAEWTLRARRLECLMCRVLWVAETIKLFDNQYGTTSVNANNSSSSSASACVGSTAAGASATVVAAGQGSTGLSGPNAFCQARTTPADMLAASRWVKEQGEELDTSFHAAAEELGLLRSRIQQLACVDLTFEVHKAALNYIRRRIEAASAAAQELRSQQLLLELAAEEEAAKKAAAVPVRQQPNQQAQQQGRSSAGASSSSESDVKATANGPAAAVAGSSAAGAAVATAAGQKGSKGKKTKQDPKPSKPAPKATSKQQQQQQSAHAASEQAKLEAAERQQALEAARAAREAAIDAELEKRRQELLVMEEAAEAELIRLAEEASLREQQALKEAAEKECQRREQQAREAAAAAAATVNSPKQQHPAVASTSSSVGAQQQRGGKSADPVKAGKQAGSAAAAASGKSTHIAAGGPVGSAEQAAAAHTAAVRPAGQRAVAVTGPGAGRAAGKQSGANRPAGLSSPAASAAITNGLAAGAGACSSKRQQQQQQQVVNAAAAGVSGTSKKSGRGGQLASTNGSRPTKGQPGSAGSTPSKQQRKQQERAQQQALQQQQQQKQQPVPPLLDFGPTPAEAYAAQQLAKGAQHAAGQELSEQQEHHASSQQQQGQHDEQGSDLAHAQPGASSPAHSPTPAVRSPSASPLSAGVSSPPRSAQGPECHSLTAADAVVHMPVSTANSSSHLALLSQHSHDGLGQLAGTTSGEHRGLFDGAAAVQMSAAPGGAFSAAAGAPASAGAFSSDAPAAGFSPAPGRHLLSLGSSHLQLQPPASDAAAVGGGGGGGGSSLSGASSLLGGLGASSAQRYGSQDLGLGFGLGSFPASRQGSAGLAGSVLPSSADGLNTGGPGGFAAVGPQGAAALITTGGAGGPAASAALPASAGLASHLLPPRPSLGTSAVSDSLLGGGATTALDASGAMFPTAAVGAGSLSMQLPSRLGVGVIQPGSPQLCCSPTEDAPHIQSIMSLLDETAAPSSTSSSSAAQLPMGRNDTNSRAGGGKGSRQQQQPQRQQQRQQRQKQQQQQRPSSRGRNSTAAVAAPDGKGAAAAAARADAAVGQAGSSSSGDLSLPAASSSSSVSTTVLSPLRPPGLSAAPPSSISSRPSSAGSTSTAAGDTLSAGFIRQAQHQMQQQPKPVSAAGVAGQMWAATATYGSTTGSGAGGQLYGGSSGWPAPPGGGGQIGLSSAGIETSMGVGRAGSSSTALMGGRVSPGGFAAASDVSKGIRGGADGSAAAAAAAAAMAASGGMWGGGGALPLHKSDVSAGRDQQRPLSAGLGGYPSVAQATHAHHNAHLAAATAAAAAAAAATAAVKQAHQQAAVAAAAAVAGGPSSSMRARSPYVAGLYSQGPEMAALFGGSSGLLGGGGLSGGVGGLPGGGGYFDGVGGFGGLTGGVGGLAGGLGSAHAAGSGGGGGGVGVGGSMGLGDVAGLWQQQQQQVASLRYPQGGLGGQQQQQQQQMWSRPPSAGGSQGVQW